jgi:sn-glycerol 3-phosphate transport system substrate-binding protein
MIRSVRSRLAATAALALIAAPAAAVEIEFFFPVAVGGDAAATIEALVAAYMEENPDVRINAIYTGGYAETTTRAITSARGGNPPQLAILLAADRFTLLDEDILEPWDNHVSEEELESWIGGFEEAFLQDSQVDGLTWGIPFQRSTPVIYWNKTLFEEAGLDPERPPETWAEMVEMGRALTIRDEAGNVTQWGVRIPTSGNPWLFTALVAAAGGEVVNETGTEVYFDTPEALEALEWLVGLSQEEGIMAEGVIDWGATPRAFLDGENAITWTTTGNLTNIRENATFPFGVAKLPAHERRCAVTGGGNIYLFAGAGEEETRAAVDFVKWATSAEQAAAWSIATGYVAPRPDAWETEAMQAYLEEVPEALVARDQLDCAIIELATFEGPRVMQILRDNLHAALTLEKTPAEALADAQREADAVLALYN